MTAIFIDLYKNQGVEKMFFYNGLIAASHGGEADCEPGFLPEGSASMLNLSAAIKNFVRDEEGQDIIEYGLLAAFIAIVVASILFLMKEPLGGIYNAILEAVQNANDAVAPGNGG